jgi:NDP-sugar pyrophosphorylase family protein
MLNVLIPMAGMGEFDKEEFHYPKPLIEIGGRPLIERVVACLDRIREEKQYVFVVQAIDCQVHHLDHVLRLITDNKCKVVQIEGATRGAACSALMAIDYIDNESSLVISNSDHIIDYDLDSVVKEFRSRNLDAGTLCFESVHPKWSFVRLDECGRIIETAEKRPLSKNAIAGFYYFRKGSDFVKAAMTMVEKDVNVGGRYYVAPAINELVLAGKSLGIHKIPSSVYHNFYSPHKIREYERTISEGT